MKTKRVFGIALMAAVMFTACSEDSNVTSPDGKTKQEKSKISIRMTDSPAAYAELNVEIDSVEIYSENDGWITLNSESQSMNVLDLNNGSELFLASDAEVDAGLYSKIRVNFAEEATLMSQVAIDLPLLSIDANNQVTLEWEGPRQVEVEIDENLQAETENSILIDFNVMESVNEGSSTIGLDVVLEELENEDSGVEGELSAETEAFILLTNGEDSISTYTNVNGEFLIRGTEEGEYSLFVFLKGDQEIDAENADATIESVAILDGEIKSVGTIETE